MWMGQALSKLMPAMDIPLDLSGGLNLPTLGFTVGIVVLATLASGTAPALLSARADLNEPLNCSATIRTLGRVASTKNVTELLIVAGTRLQELCDLLLRQLVRLDAIW